MKKTIDISLGGILFHVEEDAYYKLKKYLQSVRSSLSNTPDAKEIINEIEARIAELLLEKQTQPQQVIDTGNIDEIIAIMGQPEDYEEESEPVQNTTRTRVNKSLFRDSRQFSNRWNSRRISPLHRSGHHFDASVVYHSVFCHSWQF